VVLPRIRTLDRASDEIYNRSVNTQIRDRAARAGVFLHVRVEIID